MISFLIFLSVLSPPASAQKSTQTERSSISRDTLVLSIVQEAMSKAMNTDPDPKTCLPSVKPLTTLAADSKREVFNVKDMNGNPVPLSVVSAKEADEIQAYIAGQDHIPFDFIEAGCVQKALEVNRILKTQGLSAGMFQAGGDFDAEGEGFKVDSPPAPSGTVWKFHTGAAIAVKENGKIVVKIIDPALSKKLLTKDEWLKNLKKRATNKSKIDTNYMVMDSEYTERNLERANHTLRIYSEAQKNRPR